MPTTKMSRRASAPSAPHQTDAVGIKATATASSAKGSKSPSGLARAAGRPKPMIACRDPRRSISLATPATAKTPAKSNRATSRVVLKKLLLIYS